MLSGATTSALAIAGTAVFRMVVSSDSMKKATATSQGNNRFTDSAGGAGSTETIFQLAGIIRLTWRNEFDWIGYLENWFPCLPNAFGVSGFDSIKIFYNAANSFSICALSDFQVFAVDS